MIRKTKKTAKSIGGLVAMAGVLAIAFLSGAVGAAEPAGAAKVNINVAPAPQLQTLPGITPDLAQKIVGARPYKSVDDLARAGLTKAQIDAVRPFVTVWSPRTKKKFYRLAPGEKINLNTASEEMLIALPGIGKARAIAIVESRPFARIEDLMKLKGIKGKTFQRLKALVTV